MPSSWFHFFLFAYVCITYIHTTSSSSSSSSSTVSYSKHCSSIVPQSNITILTHKNSIPSLSTTYFTGGDRILGRKPGNQTYVYVRKTMRLRILQDYYETTANGVYKVQALLYFRFPYIYDDGTLGNFSYGASYYRRSRARGSIVFSLNGFWSEISRKLCMVGSASWKVEGGKIVNLDAVLKLKYGEASNPTIYNGVVSGILESTSSATDPSYFDPVLIFSFPALSGYNYSLISNEVGVISSDFDVARSQSLSLESNKFCSIFMWGSTFLELEYATECRENQHCSPIIGSGVELNPSLPRILNLSPIQCDEDERELRFMAKFQRFSYDDGSFSPDSIVIGEASWDDKKNMLFGVACRLLDPSSHFGYAVGDCTLNLGLRYPSILNIRNDSRIVGQFWSSKAVNDLGYFRKIDLTSADENGVSAFLWPKYEYTELARVRKLCSVREPVKKGNTYPDAHSYDMRFDMSIKNNKGGIAWGYATPLFVGDDSYRGNNMLAAAMAPVSTIEVEAISQPGIVDTNTSSTSQSVIIDMNTSPVNISYKISINPLYLFNTSNWLPGLNWSVNLHHQVEIIAEGVYNAETGQLCMVGCRNLVKNSTTISKDCEILVEFEFAPLNSRGGLIKGTIKSTRAETDPLHFDDLIMQSNAYYSEEAKKSIWRMDLEIVLVLISNALACIFVGIQIFHVRRNPEVSSFISLVMLVILSMGHMIPLVLNFDAVFLGNHNKQTLLLSNGGRIEANEVIVRAITMVAFLLQIRLLQLVWTAKKRDGEEKRSWIGEIKAGFVSFLLYILGGLLTLLLNQKRNRYVHQKYSVWGDLRSYAGLILDGFLLPQILLNIFTGSAEIALSHSFYIGTSAVRLVPHAYNQYRAHNYPTFDVNATYFYANPTADFYSTTWDIIIPCGVVALAVIVFVQQRYGGRCIRRQRFRGLEMYEKVPTVDGE